jgi:hypothetical protein
MRKDAPLAVDVPSPDRDSPGWVKVGVIAAVGFVIGIAWPRVMGVKLGPNAPGEAAAAAAAAASASASAHPHAADAPPASVSAKGGGGAPLGSIATTASAAPTGAPQVSVLRGNVISCKTTDGDTKKGKECGSLAGLDNVVPPHLRKLATCGAADGQTGKLSFIATASFPSGGLSWEVGKSSTVGNLDGITNCLKTHFTGVTAAGVAHEHNRYTVSYTATFAPPIAEASPSKSDKGDKNAKDDKGDKNAKDDPSDNTDKTNAKDPEPAAAGGEATVGWEVALVRDVPKTGGVVARLPRGSKVKLGAIKDGWYAIKFGDGFANDGFVYRGAVGR